MSQVVERYKYESAHIWLGEKIEAAAKEENVEALRRFLQELVPLVNSDQIQDLYQSDMEKDGYFDNFNVDEASTLAFFTSLVKENPEVTLDEASDKFDKMENEGLKSFKKYVKKGQGSTYNAETVCENMREEINRLKLVHAADTTVLLSELMTTEPS
jgi:hypothetical protein